MDQTINAQYTLECTVFQNVNKIKYLGVTITDYSRWNTHVRYICTRANRTLSFVRRNLYTVPTRRKEDSLHRTGVVLQKKLESAPD